MVEWQRKRCGGQLWGDVEVVEKLRFVRLRSKKMWVGARWRNGGGPMKVRWSAMEGGREERAVVGRGGREETVFVGRGGREETVVGRERT